MQKLPAYIWMPLLAFALFFCLDKIFLWPRLKFLSQPDATYLYYDYKSELLDELERVDRAQRALPELKDRPMAPGEFRKKTFLVLGSSRLLYFDYDSYARAFPDRELFNFSAPVTAPAYYLFILERVLERGVRPDYILLETDPFQFNASSDAFERSNLAYSFDFRFLFKYFNLFKREEASYFMARSLFAGFKYPPHPGRIAERLINPVEKFSLAFRELDAYQRTHRGGGRSIIPRENWYEREVPNLETTAGITLGWLYRNYRLDDRQFVFLEKFIEQAKSNGIRLVLVRPPVSQAMINRMGTDPNLVRRQKQWEARLRAIRESYGVPYLDLQRHPDYFCNTFVDAAHMAKDCYQPMMSLVMREYRQREATNGGSRP